LNIYYVAAKETMHGFVDKDNGLWWCNYGGTNLACERMLLIKDVNPNDTENIKIALKDGG
jgi:hypothetical protein